MRLQVFSLFHQVQDLAEPREVDSLLRFKRMPFEERNNPFIEVIQPPDSIRHPIAVIVPNHATSEEFLQAVEQLDITSMLDNGEFGEHLKLTGHFRVGINADVKTTFSVDKSDHPLGL